MSWSRFTSSVILISLVLGMLFFDVTFIILFLGLAFGGMLEFFEMIRKKGIPIYSYVGIFIGMMIPLSIFFRFEPTKNWELLFIVIAFLAVILMQFTRRENANATVGIATTMFGVFYVSWLFSFLIKIRMLMPGADGLKLLGFVLLVTKVADMGALFVGSWLGKHPLLPRISPNKSIEGAVGSLVFSIATAWACSSFLPAGKFVLWQVTLIGAAIGGLGQLGDLSESLIKRDCQVKDSGKFLPGLGGVLDVIDSLLFSGPAFYLYMSSVLR